MDQLVQLLCSCIKDNKVMEDADGDGIPDFMQKGKNAFDTYIHIYSIKSLEGTVD